MRADFLFILGFLPIILLSCYSDQDQGKTILPDEGVKVIVLGAVQDGGAPHIGCKKACCGKLWHSPDHTLKVSCLGIVDYDKGQTFVFDATPDFSEQLIRLNQAANQPLNEMPDGIFLTHAHIGHYTGLMYLGREAKGANKVPVYSMPRMVDYLTNHGPWSQLVELENIKLAAMKSDSILKFDNFSVTPFRVPHRDEYSETVGFKISGPNKSLLFIPDIDKWDQWDRKIIEELKKVDYAFVDATFYDAVEVNHRDISEIPHPFVVESRMLFDSLPIEERNKIHFIHMNHTNPLLKPNSNQYRAIKEAGYNIATFGVEKVL